MKATIKKLMVAVLVLALGLHTCSFALAKNGNNDFPWEFSVYKVKQGDTLSEIGRRFGVTVEELMSLNKLNNDRIRVEQKLLLPRMVSYQVQPGDTLSGISRKFNMSIASVKNMNNLDSDVIRVGQSLQVKVNNQWKTKLDTMAVSQGDGISSPAVSHKGLKVTPEEIYLLAKLIHAEARGESYQGKLAVGAVILNRVKHKSFPDSIEEVVFQRTKRGFQFSPVQDGSIKLEPDQEAWKAAKEVLNGNDPTRGALYFYNPEVATDRWIRTLPVKMTIGNHVFAEE